MKATALLIAFHPKKAEEECVITLEIFIIFRIDRGKMVNQQSALSNNTLYTVTPKSTLLYRKKKSLIKQK